MQRIFSFLPLHDRLNAALVSRNWYSLCTAILVLENGLEIHGPGLSSSGRHLSLPRFWSSPQEFEKLPKGKVRQLVAEGIPVVARSLFWREFLAAELKELLADKQVGPCLTSGRCSSRLHPAPSLVA